MLTCFEGGHRHVFRKGKVLLIRLDQRQDLAMVDEIDLIDDQKDRRLHLFELLQDKLIVSQMVSP